MDLEFWIWIILIFVMLKLFNSSWFRGLVGELQVRFILKTFLSSKDYTVINNVILPNQNGTTEIDHIVFSQYGIFVIETKNRGGWIYGNQKDKQWTQTFSRFAKFRFQNPLRQNYKHTKTITEILDVSENYVHSIVAFGWRSKFKTDMPDNVMKFHRLPSYIKSRYRMVISEEVNVKYIDGINKIRLRGVLSKVGHVLSLRR